MKSRFYTVTYAVSVGVFCGLTLTAVSQYTEPFRQANKQSDEMKNILSVLEVPVEEDTSATELVATFKKNVRQDKLGERMIYRLVGQKESGAVAVEFVGPGAWGLIRGFIALESDLKTVRGITFHQHTETPGLGGEISNEDFRRQFRGKKILDDHGRAGIKLVRGSSSGIDEVDAISGATITCDRVEDILRRLAEQIAEAR